MYVQLASKQIVECLCCNVENKRVRREIPGSLCFSADADIRWLGELLDVVAKLKTGWLEASATTTSHATLQAELGK